LSATNELRIFADAMEKIKLNKRKLLLSGLILLLVVAGVYVCGIWQLRSLNANPDFSEVPGNLLGSFNAGADNSMRSLSGNTVYFDLGSRHSFINRRAVARLDSAGSPVRLRNTLLWTTDADGRYHFYTKKVIIDLTIPNPLLPDSVYVIRNVEMLLTDDDHPNVFGMDLLHNVVIERLWPENIVNIYKEVPAGYHKIMDIDIHDSLLGSYVSSSGRASIELTVNDDKPRRYFFDTGGEMVDIEVVQPDSQLHMATSSVVTDSVTGLKIQRQCRVGFGDRLRYSKVVYCDTLHTDKYSVNPLKLFDQDLVLDMRGRRVMIHKTRS